MKKNSFTHILSGLGMLALASCSITPEAAAPITAKQSANSVAPECPGGDCSGGGSGGGSTSPCVAPTSTISARIKREAFLYARQMNWTPEQVIIGTEGCNGVYPFSLEFIRDRDGKALWVGGRYSGGTIDMDYIQP
ncbi:hypothetical protein [Hymenobacter actinosclerus]|nr:hypothetical protein [Hymenobacter actinosclerus]